MIGMAGVFYSDRGPVCPIVAHRLSTAFPGHGYAGRGLFLAQASRAVLVSARGNVCAWDGRLHNRKSLSAGSGDARPDGELALAAYERAGVTSFAELIGDWSLAVWDERAGALHLASDYAGVRPLYYCESGGRLLWSSSIGAIRAWTDCDDLDEEYAATFLLGMGSVERTPYAGIRRVPARHFLSADAQGVRVRPYWEWQPGRDCHPASSSEAGERFRELFREAVAARMETEGPVCAELSGGLDSSAVVSVAAGLVAAGAVPAPKLVTLTYDEDGVNDAPYIVHMERAFGVESIHLRIVDHPAITHTNAGDNEPLWWAPRFEAVMQRMTSIGSDVLLTGQLGDLVTGNWLDGSEQVGDYLIRGRVFGAIREAFSWSSSVRRPVYKSLWKGVASCWPLRSVAAGSVATAPMRNTLPSRRSHAGLLRHMLDASFSQSPEPLRALSYSHPFQDRRLVEFMLQAPPWLICRPGRPRLLMREALRGIVPDRILRRGSKASYEGAFGRALRPLAATLLSERRPLRVVQRGWVDPVELSGRLERLCAGLECNQAQLRRVITMEYWLRNREAKRHAPEASGRKAA